MSRVLVAVDGNEHAGAATAYLIGRARKPALSDLTDVTVVTVVPPSQRKCDDASGVREICSAARAPASVEAARPWLEDAGTSFAFRKEVGDVSNVVNRLVAEDDFDEVVLVSDRDVRSNGPWVQQKPSWWLRLAMRLGARRRARVTVMSSERQSASKTSGSARRED